VGYPAVNAFALPGGNVYLLAGTLGFVQSDDELAAVIAHEIAHVDLRHCIERHQHRAWSRRYRLETAGGLADLLRLPLLASYSKDQETEADVHGVRLLHRAGFDALAGARLMRRMQAPVAARDPRNPLSEAAGAAAESLHDYLQSHPNPAERARIMERAALRLRGNTGPELLN
jgi:predicted Zn-dependent protease